jgi:ABC-type branched-subunit amino acid transport system ATPase component
MLEIRNLHAGYGAFEALHGIDLTVSDRQIVGLIGHNGAGKSTLLKAIFGLLPVKKGTITFRGVDVTAVRAFEKAALGIRFVPQEGNVFPNLTIEDNLRLGGRKFSDDRGSLASRIDEIYEAFPALRERRHAPARVLSGGQRQMLAISIALMTEPSLLLLDEPSAGLAPIIVHQLFEMIPQIQERLGATVLLVEQNVNEVLRIAREVNVLAEGKVVFRAPSSAKEQIVRHLWRFVPASRSGGDSSWSASEIALDGLSEQSREPA